MVLVDKCKFIGGNIGLRFAIEVPSLTTSHRSIINLVILLILFVTSAFKGCGDSVLFKKPRTKNLLLLIAQTEVWGLDMNAVLNNLVLATCAIGDRAKADKHTNA